jgi:hypothetical protein
MPPNKHAKMMLTTILERPAQLEEPGVSITGSGMKIAHKYCHSAYPVLQLFLMVDRCAMPPGWGKTGLS